MGFTLAHISDVHLGPLPKTKLRELASKRITGYINWRRNRASNLGTAALNSLVGELARDNADHLAITGDLINIGLDAEVVAAAEWLRDNFDPVETTVVPGNHDAYIAGTLAKAIKAWWPYMTNDDQKNYVKGETFPFLRVRENVAIIGVSSAVATPAFVAAGRFGKRQSVKLINLLEQTRKAGLFRVVLIHHPPVRNATPPQKRLYGIGLFQDVIREYGAELVLHGHTHLPQRHMIEGPEGAKVPVIGVPSASQSGGGRKPAATYNRFVISGAPDHWHCTLTSHSVNSATSATFDVTDSRTLYG
ncbi:metallophosphoesterase family protein [Ahrensia marina]|uniref:Metallophosphatase n=1 Tax=Ahrensia marina TaxID=1514904 RepID=A0A0N0E6W0_9HYPH|nr:metallophosphoesterase [Ahrensia marina]KPB00468.1 metallophosphatase [Ahrensia marina]